MPEGNPEAYDWSLDNKDPYTILQNPNVQNWLRLIRYAEGTEGGPQSLANPYATTYGFQKFDHNKPHPLKIYSGGKGRPDSNAHGAYQMLDNTWTEMHGDNVPMTKENQDLAAVMVLYHRSGIDARTDLITKENVAKASGQWASLPKLDGRGAYEGQNAKLFENLKLYVDNYNSKKTKTGP
tara:strand:+ start:1562 stop:2104 length:543 start_codon:yes stop_codon:yes gene_type:complete